MDPVRANQEIYKLLRGGYRAEWQDKRGDRQYTTVRFVDLHDSTKNDWLAISSATKNPAKIPRPPSRDTGVECMSRLRIGENSSIRLPTYRAPQVAV